MDNAKLAERMANQKYIANGYFGGKASIVGGKVAGIKYFDHAKARAESLQEIERMSPEEREKVEKELS